MEEYSGALPENGSVPEEERLPEEGSLPKEERLPGEKAVSGKEVPAVDTKPETANSSPDKKTDAPNAGSGISDKTAAVPNAGSGISDETAAVPNAESSGIGRTADAPSAESGISDETAAVSSAESSGIGRTADAPNAESGGTGKTADASNAGSGISDETAASPNAENNAPEAQKKPAAAPHVRPRRPKQVKKRRPLLLALAVLLLLAAGAVIWLVLRGTPAEDIALGSAEVKLTKGESCRLTYQLTPADSDDEITWQVSDETVASIDAYGKVTALAEGNCVITVLTESGCKASCYLIVEPPLTEEEAAAVGNRELYAATLDGQVQYFYGKNYSLSLYSNSGGHIYCPDGSYRFTWDYSGTEGVYYCFTATLDDKTTAEIYYNADSSGSMYGTVAFRFESGNIWVFH